MKIINKLFSREEFTEYIATKKTRRAIDKIVLHHTHCTLEEWESGERSIEYYKKLYEQKEWKSGPHIFTAPEGIWLFTDVNIQGTHANAGNKGSIGIEMVGRYNVDPPHGEVWLNTKHALQALMEKLNLELSDVHFHREYNRSKLCPGKATTKKWLTANLD